MLNNYRLPTWEWAIFHNRLQAVLTDSLCLGEEPQQPCTKCCVSGQIRSRTSVFLCNSLCPSLLKSKIQTEQERGHTWQIWASEECWNTHLTFSCNYISVRTQMPKLWQTAQSLCWWMRKIHCVHVLRVKQLCSAPHSFTSNFKKIYPLEISTDIKTSNAR